ncbi:MAG: NAD-dependent epimerase/dehydratase family protein [Kofleriaceae bacterium]
MTILVTGATTPLGIAIVDALLARRETTAVIAIGANEPTPWTDPRVHYHTRDLSHPRAMHDLVWGEGREHGIETAIHLMQHRRAGDHGRRVHAQNVEALRALVNAAGAHPTLRRLVLRSYAEVYALPHGTVELLDEDAPLDFDVRAPAWVRERVEAEVIARTSSSLQVTVLRCAELFGPELGSQLWDYLQSRVCLRPMGFDPMIDVLSLPDATRAFMAAITTPISGVFNICGLDALPLSRAIALAGRADIPLPSALIDPLYALRRRVIGSDFAYDLNERRFHFGVMLDGRRARTELGYEPMEHVQWPAYHRGIRDVLNSSRKRRARWTSS